MPNHHIHARYKGWAPMVRRGHLWIGNAQNASNFTRIIPPRQTALPPSLPPRLVSREVAAAYVCVSPNTFDEMMKVWTNTKT